MTDGSIELYARLEIGQDSTDLFGKAAIRHVSVPVELFGKGVIRHDGIPVELLARDVIRHDGVPVELFGKGIIRHVGIVELLGKDVIRHVGTPVELLVRSVIRHTGIPQELFNKCVTRHTGIPQELIGRSIIRHSALMGLDAKFEICHWEVLRGVFITRHLTSLDFPASFWIRHPYHLWTDRRYLNGVVELNETRIGDAPLEYVIEGVMQDIQSYLINCNLDYSDWTDISLTPKLIKRATTYGTVAALYARKTKTFAARVIPTIAPVTITVIGDEERAMKHWRDKMNKALEYYITSQSGDVMLTSTEDEEPIFSMEDMPPVPSAYTPWYQWLMKRET